MEAGLPCFALRTALDWTATIKSMTTPPWRICGGWSCATWSARAEPVSGLAVLEQFIGEQCQLTVKTEPTAGVPGFSSHSFAQPHREADQFAVFRVIWR